MMHMTQQIMFLKNISMLGAAFLIAYFGSGPLSLDTETYKKSVHTRIKSVKVSKPVLSEV
jgi:uncharacterized membrane protein YphA (DoxX/SURF4 family)